MAIADAPRGQSMPNINHTVQWSLNIIDQEGWGFLPKYIASFTFPLQQFSSIS